MQTMQIVWLVTLVLFLILEGVTAALVSAWFCAGSLVALLIALVFPDAIFVQIMAFLIVSLITLLALRPVFQKLVGNRRVPTNADANIGKACQVVNEVQPGRFGRVRLEGQEWAAKSDYILPVGTWCRVEAIEGVKLVVTPLPVPQQ